MFTARTTQVSNLIGYPSFRPLASVYTWLPAFALGVLFGIHGFYSYTKNSSNPDITLVIQYLAPASD